MLNKGNNIQSSIIIINLNQTKEESEDRIIIANACMNEEAWLQKECNVTFTNQNREEERDLEMHA